MLVEKLLRVYISASRSDLIFELLAVSFSHMKQNKINDPLALLVREQAYENWAAVI